MIGKWWLIAIGYLGAGAAWILHDSSRDFLDRPVGYMKRRGAVHLWLVWPYVAARAAIRRWNKLRSPERFILSWGSEVQPGKGGLLRAPKFQEAVTHPQAGYRARSSAPPSVRGENR